MEDTKQRFEEGLIFYRSAAHGNGVRLLSKFTILVCGICSIYVCGGCFFCGKSCCFI